MFSYLVKLTELEAASLTSKGVPIQIIWDFKFEVNILNISSNESSAVLLYIGKGK